VGIGTHPDHVREGDAMTDGTRISARCPQCGLVELVAAQMWLVLTDPPDRAHVDFHCPACEQHVAHPADGDTVRLLSGLLAVEYVEIPAEALEKHAGPSLTTDDLIDLMLSLDGRVDAGSYARPTTFR
jgi:predicted RNA-binding Zn-ribbon protein involved in translation (DUF1610 family)